MTLRSILASSALLLAAAACGADDDRLSPERYLQRVPNVGELANAFEGLEDVERSPSGARALAGRMDAVAKRLDEFATKTDALAPPTEVEVAHEELLNGLRELSAWLRTSSSRIRSAKPNAVAGVVDEIVGTEPRPVRTILSARRKFRDAGYDLAERKTYDASGPGDPEAGRAVFTGAAGCGACHTLANAGSNGFVGPSLDDALPPYGKVIDRVTNGTGVMPSFAGTLARSQIQDLAAYVSSVAGK